MNSRAAEALLASAQPSGEATPFAGAACKLFRSLAVATFLLVGNLSLLSAAPAESKLTASGDAADLSTNLHTVTVTVLDIATQLPVRGAKITTPYYTPDPKFALNSDHWETDERGMAVVRLPLLNSQSFTIAVRHANYSAREAMWFSDAGRAVESMPATYTFKLDYGVTVGGFVRDERGAPVTGATVTVQGSGYSGFTSSSGRPTSQEYSTTGNESLVTDAKGFWSFAQFPKDLEGVRIEVLRPGGARTQFTTAPARVGYAEPADPIDPGALRATNVILTLKDGITARGIVVDESGKPVAGVRLRERSGPASGKGIYAFTNHADGRFELSHRTVPQLLLSAEADGFATRTVTVTLSPDAPETRIILPPARPLRLRVLGEREEPVAGATVQVIDWRSRNQVLDWKGETDGAGRVVWTHAPDQAVAFWIRSTNYPVRAVTLTADGTEKIVRLRSGSDKAVTIRVKATDGASGEPVARFKVWKASQYDNSITESATADNEGNARLEVKASDFQPGTMPALTLQIRAEGYALWRSESVYFDEGDQELTVTLNEAPPPAGVVLQPDGQPAENAKVFLNTGEGSVFANTPGDFYTGRGIEVQRTVKDGSFRFAAAEENNRILVAHPTGFASLTVADLQRSRDIRLQPWATVEGTLRSGGKPFGKERVSVKSPLSWANLESHHLVFSTTTDADGRFMFTNLPPGDFVLYRTPHLINYVAATESHRMPFELHAGETKRIDYGFGGRTVTGHVEADASVNWQNDPHVLELKLSPPPPAPNYYAFADPKDFQKARKAYAQSPATLEYERKRQQFQLVFDRNGDFRADDVPAGTYELRIRATKPLPPNTPRYGGNEEELGSLVRDVIIPAGAPGEEFDLGSLELPLKIPAAAGAPTVVFHAQTLEGQPFELASLSGKAVVLTFWARWAPFSGARLNEMRALLERPAMKERVALVTVNLDEDDATARTGVEGLEKGWTHTRLEGVARAEVTEQFSVETLPLTLVLDGQGRVQARDVDDKRLQRAVERVLEKQIKN